MPSFPATALILPLYSAMLLTTSALNSSLYRAVFLVELLIALLVYQVLFYGFFSIPHKELVKSITNRDWFDLSVI